MSVENTIYLKQTCLMHDSFFRFLEAKYCVALASTHVFIVKSIIIIHNMIDFSYAYVYIKELI